MNTCKGIALGLLLAVLVSACSDPNTSAPIALAQEEQTQETTSTPDSTSLYMRLGGIYPIASVVDDFIERLLVNDILNANPAIEESRARVPKAGLKYRVTEMVGSATGGPQTYTGRSMSEAHGHLNITEEEWQAMISDFQATLDHFDVPAQEQGELIAILESTKPDIVAATI